MLTDIADTSRTVRLEQESEYLPDEIGIYLALVHIFGAFGTSVKPMTFDA